jgi:uncharacterized protein (TIGR02452 family)
MGRTIPSVTTPPQSSTRATRSKIAKTTLNKTIPSLLVAYPRAKLGVDSAVQFGAAEGISSNSNRPSSKSKSKAKLNSKGTDLPQIIDELPKVASEPRPKDKTPVNFTLQVTDTLTAAHNFYLRSRNSRKPNSPQVAILNMASPLRPGGGFLTGATSQEESLCMRTTLLPSLLESFYRLPDLGGIYTPDVLVFRSGASPAVDLPKSARFFVDVVTAGMLRFPDVQREGEEEVYVDEKDRVLVRAKMQAVMSVLAQSGVRAVILGAWGCGAYGNPVGEVARAWRDVLMKEEWEGVEEVVFAINNRRMASDFAGAFDGVLEMEIGEEQKDEEEKGDEEEGREEREVREKIGELEVRIGQARTAELRLGMERVLEGLRSKLGEADGD